MKELEDFKAALLADFERRRQDQQDHIKATNERYLAAIDKMLEWLEECECNLSGGFHTATLKINGVDASWLNQSIVGCPYFDVNITFQPIHSTDNIGNGCGNPLTIDFMKQ